MALTDAYFNEQDYRAYAGKIGNAPTFIDAQAKAVSRFLDGQLGVPAGNFNRLDEAVAKRIDPLVAGTTLAVKPIAALTDLEILVDTSRTGSFAGLTPLTSGQYQLAYDGDYEPTLRGLPYNQVVVPTWSTAQAWSTTSPVQITAVWGWPSIPDAVKICAMELLRLLRLETPRAQSSFNPDAGMVLGTNAQARSLTSELARQYHPTGLVIA